MRLATVIVLLSAFSLSSTPLSAAAEQPVKMHKEVIVGLIDKGSEAPYHLDEPYPTVNLGGVSTQSPAFSGIVVNQTWAQLEPEPGAFDFESLDTSLASVATFNRSHPRATLGVRLRIFAAYAAPPWAKDLDGGPITIPAHQPGNTGGTLGRWWTPDYRSAWSKLQQALAARYDSNPLIREVAVSSCSTLTAEPFVMAPTTVAIATSDGWTMSDQQNCLDGAFSDYAPWAHTAIYFPMNPLDGNHTVTDQIMERCVASSADGGPLCILGNNALDPVSDTTGRSAPIYGEMDALWSARPQGTPIGFQMNGPTSTTYCASIGIAVSHHAHSVELWPATAGSPGYSNIPTSTLTAWSKDLRTGRQPACPTG
jgi:hypothetical protein